MGIALKLRSVLLATHSQEVPRRAQWLAPHQQRGCKTPMVFDAKGLTFIISSWMFDWQSVDFGCRPIAYDHGAHTPGVAVFTPRPAGDGYNVYHSGTQAAVEHFA